jgi:SAM-dependent methyltransferase
VAALAAIDAQYVRGRVAAFPVLDATDEPAPRGYRFVTAAGVVVDAATARAATAHAAGHGLDALDLLPGDLPVERLLDLARLVDATTFRDDPIVLGRGAYQALLVTEELARRVGIDAYDGLDTDAMAALTVRLKRYAPRSTAHALAPSLVAAPAAGAGRLDATYALLGPGLTTAGLVADLVLLGLAARSRRPAALAAAAARLAQPALAVRGTAARPRDLATSAPARLVSSARDLPRAVARWWRESDVEDRRPAYDEMLAGGVAAFLGERRPDCPLCGSTELTVRVESLDMLQCKPGRFTLEECRACAHVFQNPQLTAEGLDFYYRDYYDGADEEAMNALLTRFRPYYAARAEMLRPHHAPVRWLDVGTGHGHFCNAARDVWPETVFDGLDMSEQVVEAERRGWTDRSYRGGFPETAGSLAGRYDVVSMVHYLEHTPEPEAQLDAAATVLAPGGWLLVEVPDPESRLADLLGVLWPPWGQPQHLHFVSVGNLRRLLRDRGFEVVEVVRGEARIGLDFLGAAKELVNGLVPAVAVPWRPRPTPAERAARIAALAAAAPLMVAGLAVDAALLPLRGEHGTSNTYRLLARKAGATART